MLKYMKFADPAMPLINLFINKIVRFIRQHSMRFWQFASLKEVYLELITRKSNGVLKEKGMAGK